MNRFAEALDSGRLLVTAECLPPRGADYSEIRGLASSLPSSLDAVVVTDNRDAIRGSAFSAAVTLTMQGASVVMSMATRDRNRYPLLVMGKQIEVDEDGFIVEPSLWNEDIVKAFAKLGDVAELTENHWKVINYLRDYYQKFGIAPMIRKLCKETGFSLQKIYELFPRGPARGACKVAGLPKPTGCV